MARSKGLWPSSLTAVRTGKKTTARHIELYSSAYKLAWTQIFALQKCGQARIALGLHASIRRQLREGATDPLLIASEALSDLRLAETK